MYRKLLILLSLFLPFIAAAQTLVGSWNFNTPFGAVNSIVETPSKVYFVSQGSLFSYDKTEQESYAYTTTNRLNDTGVNQIYYNPAGKYLLVTYTNGNMDFLYDDDHVANMSDIKDAVLTSSKLIHGVSFVDGKIYIATEFGVVLADEKYHTVKESGIYNKKINSFTKIGDHYVIGTPDGVYAAPQTARINNLGNFTKISDTPLQEIYPVAENKALIRPEKNISIASFNFNDGTMTVEKSYGGEYPYTVHGNYWADGFYFTNGMTIAVYNDKESGTSLKWLSDETRLYRQPLAFWSGTDNLWTSTSDGVANVNWVDEKEVVYLTDYFKLGDFTVNPVDVLVADNFGNVYATKVAITRKSSVFYEPNAEQPYRKATNINMITPDGVISDVTPDNLPNPYSTVRYPAYEPYSGSKMMSMGSGVTPHPKKPGILFSGNRYDGLYKISATDGFLNLYNSENSKILWDGWQSYVGQCDFDGKGNLWVAQYVNSDKESKNTNLLMLPADKVDNESTTAADWIAMETPVEISLDPMVTALKGSNIVCLYSSNGNDSRGIVFYDNRGTNAVSDDRLQHYISYIDQDGKQFSPLYTTCVREVENGKLWVGTDDGVFEVANPASMIGEGRVTRIKVPRNDGTGQADYLMGSQIVMDIAMDASKNKWIATQEGGLFQVSADGRTILRNFTKDNSPLPTNRVLSVECSPSSNVVYIGTDEGLYEYHSDTAPAEYDYSNVIAYPNPVRPEYSGWITIKGLMADSLVKITDSTGNIVSQGDSQGGMYTWDGCNFNGERVRTGVYYVYASQSGDSGSNAVVTKIMIVR